MSSTHHAVATIPPFVPTGAGPVLGARLDRGPVQEPVGMAPGSRPDPGGLLELVETLANVPLELQRAIRCGGRHAVARIARRLAGQSRLLGLETLQRAAMDVERDPSRGSWLAAAVDQTLGEVRSWAAGQPR